MTDEDPNATLAAFRAACRHTVSQPVMLTWLTRIARQPSYAPGRDPAHVAWLDGQRALAQRVLTEALENPNA